MGLRLLLLVCVLLVGGVDAMAFGLPADSVMSRELGEAGVRGTVPVRRMAGAVNGVSIGREELFRAACCNLGESFVTNPSVDVSYSDAATGAKQIKLLGLSGTYVQMLTENLPALRGAALPYALEYVPGAWLKNIQVSKGNASVKNGYESITGQINVDYKKAEDEKGLEVNVYGNQKLRFEANGDGNFALGEKWNTIVMVHGEQNFESHDANNDGFQDKPKVKQFNVRNHWIYESGRYAFRAGVGAIGEERESGQMHSAGGSDLFKIELNTNRYDGYMKHAFILDALHGTNIALMAAASMHELEGLYGVETYYVNEKNAYASLIFETDLGDVHNLSAGLSLNYDYLSQRAESEQLVVDESLLKERETTPGAYGQYTLNLRNKLIAMAGLRVDHSSRYGTFCTPRFHLKWMPSDVLSLRGSVGKGYRTVHALAENNYLLSSGRTLVINDLEQEEAWNMGVSVGLSVPIGGRMLRVNGEYYYTTFGEQAVVDYDSDPLLITITNLQGHSFSHTIQVDASYELFKGLTATAAYRWNRAKTTYGDRLLLRPLTSKYKGLLSLQYKTPLELWQFDVTLGLNGGGRLPSGYGTYHAFEQLSAQVTRDFRYFSVYVGGENLTNFKQKNPILGADDPWSTEFDPTMVWGPVEGWMVYAGVRVLIRN